MGDNMKKIINLILIIFLAIISNLSAQNERVIPASLGLYAGININMHNPDFIYPINGNDISFNNTSTGFGGALGFTGFYQLSNMFVISGKLGYNGLGATLSSKEYEFDASLNYIEISPELQFHNLIPVKDLFLIGGLETGIQLSPKYSITNTNPKIENENISDAKFRIAGIVGLGYFLELTRGVYLTPELTYRLSFTDISNQSNLSSWSVPQIRLGVSLTFALTEPPEVTAQKPKYFNLGFKEVRYFDNQGNPRALDRIKVEEVKYTEQFPLVASVFNDENKVEPSNSSQFLYAKSDAGEFSISSLVPDALRINQSTLDIIGTRMLEYPDANLTLTGTIDNKAEAVNKDLSLQRAQFVKDYLVNNYKIAQERITVKGVGLPEKPSTLKDPDGIAENRRVEFSSSNPKILEPILIQKDNQTYADPNVIEFIPYAESSDSILEWKLSINQKGNEIRTFAGKGAPEVVDWVIIPNELVKSEVPIEYILWAKNENDIEKEVAGTVPVEFYTSTRKKTEDLPDKIIAKFSLILFDFDDDKISKNDMEIINRDIIPLIKFNSTVKIIGYTDRIGDENYNKGLAERRALSVRKYLESKVKTAKYEYRGAGETPALFDNDLPVGRQLSRTVQIEIISPR
ncbi:OmpA family protein [Bacteroidetes/Chlorobi group bacterium ChocPot_Mid]|nr:MAG: OmpA family protein [Bacteroidetes/Chlorobi group bacterium ChocPot_Mid]